MILITWTILATFFIVLFMLLVNPKRHLPMWKIILIAVIIYLGTPVILFLMVLYTLLKLSTR